MSDSDELRRARITQLEEQQRLLAQRLQRLVHALALTEELIADLWHASAGPGDEVDAQTATTRAVTNAASCRQIGAQIARLYGPHP